MAMLRTALPVWVLVVVGAVLVGLLAVPAEYLTWLPIVLGAAVLLTFSIQLGIVRRAGLVTRVMVSVGGSVVILVIATAVLGTIALAAG
ncbi:hypothetical protein GCM10027052_16930 [Parafrigoribacterium mesophilum]|uniref:hypothetical protein n=1 Tax=Parafrigoribacterium mesophilum TaxID=433646 RepID=UPI0031FC4AEB